MRRVDLEHVVAAAAQISDEVEIVVIGSQAILATDDPPPELVRSMEADIYPRYAPQKAEEIDGSLGDGSQFHRTYGYYAHGVGPETAKAPAGWEERLVEIEVEPRPGSDQPAVALCLEAHDLVLAKCAAGRKRDWEFARDALGAGLVQISELLGRVGDLPIDDADRAHVRRMLEGRSPG
jgi:hypothetical protein